MDQKYGFKLDLNVVWKDLTPAGMQSAAQAFVEELELGAYVKMGRIVIGTVESVKLVPDNTIDVVVNFATNRIGEIRVVQ